MNDAYFLKYLSKDPKLNIPDIDDEDIIIYLPKKGSGKYLLFSSVRPRYKQGQSSHCAAIQISCGWGDIMTHKIASYLE